MPISTRHSEIIRVTPEKAFALLDDLPATAQWLPGCVSLENTSSGPNRQGDILRYVFREGRRESEMEGVIATRVPGERLHCVYTDSAFIVSADMRVEPESGQTRLTNIIGVTPRTLMGWLMWPMIRFCLGGHVRKATANIRKILESD